MQESLIPAMKDVIHRICNLDPERIDVLMSRGEYTDLLYEIGSEEDTPDDSVMGKIFYCPDRETVLFSLLEKDEETVFQVVTGSDSKQDVVMSFSDIRFRSQMQMAFAGVNHAAFERALMKKDWNAAGVALGESKLLPELQAQYLQAYGKEIMAAILESKFKE
jgi:hypothetical protein